MLYRVFGVLRQSVDQGLNPIYLRFSFFLRALYPKESSLPLFKFLQARFKNIKAGFHRYKLWLFFSVGAPDCASFARENIQLCARLLHVVIPKVAISNRTARYGLCRRLRLFPPRYHPKSANGGRKKKREKKNLELGVALRPRDSSPAGDFFSPCGVKKRLL
ncbi:hypothetical protein BHM03_00030269, partial [Ensete ventricosum]